MTAAVSPTAGWPAYEEATERRDAAAEAERAAFAAWQEAYGAFEVARDECADTFTRAYGTQLAR